MPKAADNVTPAKTEAIKKRITDGKDQPQKEWRVAGQPGLVLITRPTGTGSFYAYYNPTFGKKRRKYKLGDFPAMTLADAIRMALEVRAQVGQGADPALARNRERSGITFKDMAERFLDEAPLSTGTRYTYRAALEKDAYPAIGDMPAGIVTADDVLAICEKIRKRGNGVQPQRTKAAIGGVYRWGIGKRLVAKNPARELGNQQLYKTVRDKVPTDAEIKALWYAPDGTRMSKAMKIIIRLGILLGQRRTEIAGARLSELDLQKATWTIPASKTKAGKLVEEGRMKNKREQVVYLSTQAVELFREAVNTTSDGNYLFPADTSRHEKTRAAHIHGESVSRAVRRACEKLGIEDLRMHDMRRAITTFLGDRDDLSDRVLNMILHHTRNDVTSAHYDKARREKQLRKAWQLWADHIEKVAIDGERAS